MLYMYCDEPLKLPIMSYHLQRHVTPPRGRGGHPAALAFASLADIQRHRLENNRQVEGTMPP